MRICDSCGSPEQVREYHLTDIQKVLFNRDAVYDGSTLSADLCSKCVEEKTKSLTYYKRMYASDDVSNSSE